MKSSISENSISTLMSWGVPQSVTSTRSRRAKFSSSTSNPNFFSETKSRRDSAESKDSDSECISSMGTYTSSGATHSADRSLSKSSKLSLNLNSHEVPSNRSNIEGPTGFNSIRESAVYPSSNMTLGSNAFATDACNSSIASGSSRDLVKVKRKLSSEYVSLELVNMVLLEDPMFQELALETLLKLTGVKILSVSYSSADPLDIVLQVCGCACSFTSFHYIYSRFGLLW
eukprot:CAMPEP_0196577144 /NCGR_PEP_ID=MMETSP1081-20130531/6252_1 /TAXON_ID=36882 /ORGANISM="Pyramimonas amylifera, Strain CCMP720" /LENGTH=228 /DNA_ID=CAMNT_0041895971 /DNA_START=74 /DNA_END=757 /DNA_ORIENTATION=+